MALDKAIKSGNFSMGLWMKVCKINRMDALSLTPSHWRNGGGAVKSDSYLCEGKKKALRRLKHTMAELLKRNKKLGE